MAERIAEIIVLAEDARQGNLVYHYLVRKGHNWRSIRVRPVPLGQGSGEQYVREHYAGEVKHYRNRRSRRRAALVVIIDADSRRVTDKERELAATLLAAGEDKRRSGEAIALLIPKRNIETWILCLLGDRVDETTDYKGRRDVDANIKPAAHAFCEWSKARYPVPDSCVESLHRGLREAKRIP